MNEPDIKARIIKGAGELFVRYGVRSITMDDIAHHLGISKKTLYQHFADKDEIVVSAMNSYINKRCIEFEGVREKVKNAVEGLALMSERLKESVRNANPSMLFDIQKYHQKAWTMWKTYRNQFVRESLIKNLNKGIEQGYYRDDLNPTIVATIRMEMIQMGFDEQIFPKDEFSTADVQVQLLEHFAQGILTVKGKKLYDKYKMEMSQIVTD